MTEFYIFGEQSPQSEIKHSFLFRFYNFSIISTPFSFPKQNSLFLISPDAKSSTEPLVYIQ